MEAKANRDRIFSVELRSKADLRNVSVTDGSRDGVLVEGTIGALQQLGFTEGIILEVVGERGVLRIDLDEDELSRVLQAASCEKQQRLERKSVGMKRDENRQRR